MIQVQTINYILTTKDKEFIEENNLTSSLFKGYETEFNFIKNHLNIYGQVPDVSTFKESFPNFEILNVEESPKYLLTELNNDYNQSILTTELFAIRDLINEVFSSSSLKAWYIINSCSCIITHINNFF